MNSPVLFLVFNRPDCTQLSFEAIRAAKPSKLYIAADGPREHHPDDLQATKLVRATATAVDWPCEVYKLFREVNLGCRQGVSSAIDWFFSNEEQGIILEDDCLPSADFFVFCEALLDRYRDDKRVSMIAGTNFVPQLAHPTSSYRFTRYPHIWGWASWRRAWRSYDSQILLWPEWRTSLHWNRLFSSKAEKAYWESIMARTYNGEIDTWDYQLAAAIWRDGGLVACPNVNLVQNIGFDNRATHTTRNIRQCKVQQLGRIDHPAHISLDVRSDSWYFALFLSGQLHRILARCLFALALLKSHFIRSIRRMARKDNFAQ